MSESPDTHYRVLGVAELATKEQILGRYRDLSTELERQRNDGPDDVTRLSRRQTLSRVTEAYAVLSDDDRRGAYDLELTRLRQPQRDEALKKVPRRPSPTQCEYCAYEPAVAITLRRGVGMFYMRRRTISHVIVCRRCGLAQFRAYQDSTLIRGWWGMISFFMNFFYIFANTRAYFTLRSLGEPKRPEGVFVVPRSEPANPGRPLVARVGLLCSVGAVLVAGAYVQHLGDANPNTLNGLPQDYQVGACVAHSGHYIVGMVSCAATHFAKVVAIKVDALSCPTYTDNYFVDTSPGLLYHRTVCLRATS